MGILKEFRDFAVKGNVADMAVGIIMGAAFGKIVSSLVNDVMMPPLGMLMGQLDFSDLAYTMQESYPQVVQEGGKEITKMIPAVKLRYGLFINQIIDFLLVATAVFLLVKQINALKKRMATDAPAAAPSTKTCPECCSTIPLAAKRCPNCTSQLEGPSSAS